MKSFFRCALALLGLLPVQLMAVEDGKYADFGGVKIHYIDRGKGEAIVLLHGGTSSLESWVRTGVVDNLSKDYRVIAFDARGHGKSGRPHDPKQYGRQQALDVPRLLDALKIANEAADVVRTITEALESGDVDALEKRAITREIDEAIKALQCVQRRIGGAA